MRALVATIVAAGLMGQDVQNGNRSRVNLSVYDGAGTRYGTFASIGSDEIAFVDDAGILWDLRASIAVPIVFAQVNYTGSDCTGSMYTDEVIVAREAFVSSGSYFAIKADPTLQSVTILSHTQAGGGVCINVAATPFAGFEVEALSIPPSPVMPWSVR